MPRSSSDQTLESRENIWSSLSANEKARYITSSRSLLHGPPGPWTLYSAKEEAEEDYHKTKGKDNIAPNTQSAASYEHDADWTRQVLESMRHYDRAESMEPDTSECQRQQAPRAEDDNPFIAFRRYADSQLSSLLQGVIGLPSMFSSPEQRAKWQDVDKAQQRAKEMQSWGGVGGTEEWEHGKTSQTNDVEKPSDESASGETRCPYLLTPESRNGRSGRGVQQPLEMPRSIPEIDQKTSDPKSNLNDISYATFNPYTPLRLANDPRFSGSIDRWKEAYNDLMCVEEQQEMRNIENYNRYCKEFLVPCDWRGSVHRSDNRGGNLGGVCKVIALSHPKLRAMVQAKKDAETELGLYESSQAIQSSSNTGDAVDSSSSQTTEATSPELMTRISNKSPPRSIVSTMTTTERWEYPDGTVNTKVVLKKRFADGKKESTETVLKSQDDQGKSQQDHSHPAAGKERFEKTAKEGAVKKRGWFWSD